MILERDPKDQPYLDLALATEASYLVSRDRDLLDLMKDGSDIRVNHPELLVLEPQQLLQRLRGADRANQ